MQPLLPSSCILPASICNIFDWPAVTLTAQLVLKHQFQAVSSKCWVEPSSKHQRESVFPKRGWAEFPLSLWGVDRPARNKGRKVRVTLRSHRGVQEELASHLKSCSGTKVRSPRLRDQVDGAEVCECAWVNRVVGRTDIIHTPSRTGLIKLSDSHLKASGDSWKEVAVSCWSVRKPCHNKSHLSLPANLWTHSGLLDDQDWPRLLVQQLDH